jgi:hypothetical protein
MMGRKQTLKDGLEYDVIYGRHIYCYLKNRPVNVKYAKRKMNKRMRRDFKRLDNNVKN